MNLKQMLEEAARRYGEKTAIVLGDHGLSYAELDEASNKVANALIGMGVGKGDRVAMLLSNSPEFVIIYFGIVKIGAIAVPLDPKYKLTELASLYGFSAEGSGNGKPISGAADSRISQVQVYRAGYRPGF